MAETHGAVSSLVVIGSSAGGIEALSEVVGKLPATFAAPVVIGQHLSPRRGSNLGEILGRRSPLPVRIVSDRERLEPGVVYVIPPDHDVVIRGDSIQVHQDGPGSHPSIDLLFSSAAEAFEERVIGVVLSGTGSDGAAGARDIKFAGGTVIIENPETAAYPGMPQSLAPSVVDVVANKDRIAELLDLLVAGEFDAPPVSDQAQLVTFLDQIRDHSGIDFSAYKQATIQRRLQRRMIATGQHDITQYIRHVRSAPDERQRLISSFLIKVTDFFRDPELYTHLREQVLPELIADSRRRGVDLRIWSAGCATGEEAYSLAITIADLLAAGEPMPDLRIFATDLDQDAVAFARRGIYPARALQNLPQEMVSRHFVKVGDDFEVGKHLRAMLVFGEHDLGQRAPFPRIDLIFCRNVLIYFTPTLQRRALQLFAFSLRPDGYLVLGKSETVDGLAEFFKIDHPRLKSYQRVGKRVLIPTSRLHDTMAPPLSPLRSVSVSQGAYHPAKGRDEAPSRVGLGAVGQALLGLPVGVALVNRNYDIRYLNSELRRFFGIHSVALDEDLIHLIHHFDPVAVRAVIDQARTSGQLASQVIASIDSPSDGRRALEISCVPYLPSEDAHDPLLALTAIDVTDREELRRLAGVAKNDVARLVQANQDVLAANQELTTSIIRLRARNEELLVAVEEVQAATEEVETLNEELQATNEELETFNEELQATVEELNTTSADMEARTAEMQALAIDAESSREQLRVIINAIQDGVVVVDGEGAIVLENVAYASLLASHKDGVLLDADRQPIAEADTPVQRAARGESFAMRFTFGPGNTTWYNATGTSRIADGAGLAVVTFREVAQ